MEEEHKVIIIGRVSVGVWGLVCLILACFYTSDLRKNLMLNDYSPDLNTDEAAVKSNRTVYYLTSRLSYERYYHVIQKHMYNNLGKEFTDRKVQTAINSISQCWANKITMECPTRFTL